MKKNKIRKQSNMSLDDDVLEKLEEATTKTNKPKTQIVEELVRLFLPSWYDRLGFGDKK